MVHPWGFRFYCTLLYRIAASIRNNIRLTTPDQQLAPPRKSAAQSNTKQVLVGDLVGERFANLVTRESKCRRITVRPWQRRCSLSGDSSKRTIVAGCSE